MQPAALADLVGRIHVNTVCGAQSLDQLETKLGIARSVLARDLHLSQPLTRPTNDEIVESHTLTTTTQRIQRIPTGGVSVIE